MNTENKHGVCKKQWNRWENRARCVFNKAYESVDQVPCIRVDQNKELSKMVAWNAAFTAACEVQDLVDDMKDFLSW